MPSISDEKAASLRASTGLIDGVNRMERKYWLDKLALPESAFLSLADAKNQYLPGNNSMADDYYTWLATQPGGSVPGSISDREDVAFESTALSRYKNAVLADSPLLFVTFENPAARWNDLSGNSRHGTLTTGAPSVSDTLGPGGIPRVIFTSVNDLISWASATWMDTPNDITVEYWLKAASGVAAQGNIFSRDVNAANTRWWITYKDGSDSWGAYPNNQAGPIYLTVADVCNGAWHHLAATWTYSGSGFMYVDGVQDRICSPIGSKQSAATPITLGGTATLVTRLDLEVAAVALYGAQLSSGRVLAHKQALVP